MSYFVIVNAIQFSIIIILSQMFWSYSVPKPLLRDIIQKAECNVDCSMPHKVYILGSIMAFYWGLWYTVVSNSLYWILPIGSVQWYLELNSFKFGDVWQTNFVPTIDILLKIHTYLIYYMEATLKKKRAFPWSNTHQCFIFVKWHFSSCSPSFFISTTTSWSAMSYTGDIDTITNDETQITVTERNICRIFGLIC